VSGNRRKQASTQDKRKLAPTVSSVELFEFATKHFLLRPLLADAVDKVGDEQRTP